MRQDISELGEFWERITFPDGTVVGPGRSKEVLWRDYLSKSLHPEEFVGKSILDLGCNAGGNLIELSKFRPSRLVGVEGNETFYRQAQFVVDEFNLPATVIRDRFARTKTADDYAKAFGKFDIIFCLGIIYHLDRGTNVELLKYIRQNSDRSFFSTQLEGHPGRPGVDWHVSRSGTVDLLLAAGFRGVRDLYEKKGADTWAGLTNSWYFEAV